MADVIIPSGYALGFIIYHTKHVRVDVSYNDKLTASSSGIKLEQIIFINCTAD